MHTEVFYNIWNRIIKNDFSYKKINRSTETITPYNKTITQAEIVSINVYGGIKAHKYKNH